MSRDLFCLIINEMKKYSTFPVRFIWGTIIQKLYLLSGITPPLTSLSRTVATIFKTLQNFWSVIESGPLKKKDDRNPESNRNLSYSNLSPLSE